MTRNELRAQFIADVLLPTVLSPEHRAAFNLRIEFRKFLQTRDFPRERASEVAEEELIRLVRAIETRMREWDEQGVPRPLHATDQEAVFVTWAHGSFVRYAGHMTIDRNYCEILQYVRTAGPKRFVILSALWLRCLGCRRILVSDGPHDGGVDVLGVIGSGGLRSLAVFVQSKTSSSKVNRDTIAKEHSTFSALAVPTNHRFAAYRKALNIETHEDGTATVYLVLSNNSFDGGARKMARTLGLLLRSPQQIAQLLSRRYSLRRIEEIVEVVAPSVRADLTRNLWEVLSW